jgi:type II secretory pathway component GspD/PulD (secretin)
LFGQAAQAPAGARENRIRVVAHPETNSLLVKASPLDMLKIHDLLDKYIDAGDAEPMMKTWTRAVQARGGGRAGPAAPGRLPRADQQQPRTTTVGGFRGVGFIGGGQQASTATSAPTATRGRWQLSIAVDDRNNRLIVACSAQMHDDIKKLTDDLEEAAGKENASRAMKVIPIKGIDVHPPAGHRGHVQPAHPAAADDEHFRCRPNGCRW